jgi:4-hydroxy-tetrahydrodipicolinate synthase
MARKPVLHVPVITPLAADGRIDVASLTGLVRHVLAEGAAGIVLFGTLGEAQSLSVAERKATLEALLASGVETDRIILGTGAAALTDVVDLSRHALSCGCFRQLLLPPFFFKGIQDEGLYAFVSAAIDGVDDERLRLTLYDIPGVVSVAIAGDVIARLLASHGPIIAGIKDSVPSWEHVEENLLRFPQLDIFVGNEIFLPQALALGGAGAIAGLGNIAPAPMAAIVTAGADTGSPRFLLMCELYRRIARHPVIPAVKALTARARGSVGLAMVRAPLVAFDLATAPELGETVDALVSGTD